MSEKAHIFLKILQVNTKVLVTAVNTSVNLNIFRNEFTDEMDVSPSAPPEQILTESCAVSTGQLTSHLRPCDKAWDDWHMQVVPMVATK